MRPAFAIGDKAYDGAGVMINSGFLDGLAAPAEAKAAAIAELERLGVGEGVVNWRLRDWGVSRQRYWGCPIPVIHCDAAAWCRCRQAELPVVLPEDVSVRPAGQSAGPPSDLEARGLPRRAAGRRGARPTRSTRSSTVPGISPAFAARTRPSR